MPSLCVQVIANSVLGLLHCSLDPWCCCFWRLHELEVAFAIFAKITLAYLLASSSVPMERQSKRKLLMEPSPVTIACTKRVVKQAPTVLLPSLHGPVVLATGLSSSNKSLSSTIFHHSCSDYRQFNGSKLGGRITSFEFVDRSFQSEVAVCF